MFGIDAVNKKTCNRLCNFVQPGGMHKMFTPLLREDKMGIDYSNVDFEIYKYLGLDKS